MVGGPTWGSLCSRVQGGAQPAAAPSRAQHSPSPSVPPLTPSGGGAEGAIVANLYWDPKSDAPLIRSFVEQFRKSYDEEPEVYGAAGYDCIKVVAAAIEKGGTSSEGIKQALYQIKGYKGVTGDITFDEYGDVRKEYDVFTAKEGEFQSYQ